MSLFATMRIDVDRLLRDTGAEVTLRRSVKGVYDPSAGAPSTSTDITQTVIVTFISFRANEFEENDVVRGGRLALISAKDSSDVVITPPVVGDRLEGIGDGVDITRVHTVYSQGSPIVYECRVKE